MRFWKYQGCGNDYIYVDCISHRPPRDAATLSKTISDRHFGVGSDGLILICPSERADCRMRMFNADGSESEMCGNGIRCVAKCVYDHGLVRKPTVTIETGRGILTLELQVSGGKVRLVCVDMGEPILEAGRVPTTLAGNPAKQGAVVDGMLQLGDDALQVTCVSMGNPHCVSFVDTITDALVHVVGPKVERHPAFPKRTNVEFVKVNRPDDATMRVWERGSGETLACGTGACASAVAGVLAGRLQRHVVMHLRGGDLDLRWSESDNHVYMTGPAVEVFSGEWPDEAP